jgi:hypothetical protein
LLVQVSRPQRRVLASVTNQFAIPYPICPVGVPWTEWNRYGFLASLTTALEESCRSHVKNLTDIVDIEELLL